MREELFRRLPQYPARRASTKWAPPVRYLPREQVDPPRMAPAAEWRSAFCTKWHDGCEQCERSTAAADPHCAPTAISAAAPACRRHPVTCSEVDEHALDRVCRSWTRTELSLADQKRLLAGAAVSPREYGMHNDWSRVGDGYEPAAIDILLIRRPLNLTILRDEWRERLGQVAIVNYHCPITYLEQPPMPSD
jgi:hypothetical protein